MEGKCITYLQLEKWKWKQHRHWKFCNVSNCCLLLID